MWKSDEEGHPGEGHSPHSTRSLAGQRSERVREMRRVDSVANWGKKRWEEEWG